MSVIKLGVIGAPVGLKGYFRCFLYSYPPNWKQAKTLVNHEEYTINLVKYPYNKNLSLCLCSTDTITTRSGLSALNGLDLFIDRGALPETDNEIYFADIMNLPIHYMGTIIGTLEEVHDFGSGPILESNKGTYISWDHQVEQVLDGVIYLKENSLKYLE